MDRGFSHGFDDEPPPYYAFFSLKRDPLMNETINCKVPVVITQEGAVFVAECPILDVFSSCGLTPATQVVSGQ